MSGSGSGCLGVVTGTGAWSPMSGAGLGFPVGLHQPYILPQFPKKKHMELRNFYPHRVGTSGSRIFQTSLLGLIIVFVDPKNVEAWGSLLDLRVLNSHLHTHTINIVLHIILTLMSIVSGIQLPVIRLQFKGF